MTSDLKDERIVYGTTSTYHSGFLRRTLFSHSATKMMTFQRCDCRASQDSSKLVVLVLLVLLLPRVMTPDYYGIFVLVITKIFVFIILQEKK